jgi:hypothetical protein
MAMAVVVGVLVNPVLPARGIRDDDRGGRGVFPIVMQRSNGQTPGKRSLDVRVIRDDGKPMTAARGARRDRQARRRRRGLGRPEGVATALAVAVTWT